jgi:hypothetical protein
LTLKTIADVRKLIGHIPKEHGVSFRPGGTSRLRF